MYVVDTNLYVRAFRDATAEERLLDFQDRVLPQVYVHGVVAYELRAGTRTAEQQSGVDALIAAFVARGQTLGASYAAYVQAGRVMAGLVRAERLELATAPPSLFQDAVLAASCREHGATLVTENGRDFTAIARHLRGFRFVGPWP